MSNKYETEIERFINRSLEHLKRTGRQGMRIIIRSMCNETGKKYRAEIVIREEEDEEDEH